MQNDRIVVSISGHGECGKDTAAEILQKYTGIPYKKSTSACVIDVWWDEISSGMWSASNEDKPLDLVIEPGDYDNKEEFYEDRRMRRMEWVEYIEWFNLKHEHGIGLYIRTVEHGNQILTGIRRTGQFQRCRKHLIDLAIWMDRPGIPVDESQEYGSELCDVIVKNDGTISDLDHTIQRLCLTNPILRKACGQNGW